MYVPRPFTVEDPATIEAVIVEHSFATLVTSGGRGITATHLPLAFDPQRGIRGTLTGHLARANRQWEEFDGETEALAIFAGPHAYISPSWYASPQSVPTWDYVAVHAYGRPRIVSDEATVLRMLSRLVEQYESHMPETWSMASQDPAWLQRMALGIVAFEMPVERIQAKAKLGQTRPADQASVANALTADGQEGIARLIREANNLG